MMAWLRNNAEQAGWLATWVLIVFMLCMFATGAIAALTMNELPLHYIAPPQTLIYCILFLLFLYGVRGFAVRMNDASLLRTMNSLMAISVLEMLFYFPFAFPLFIESNFLTILLVAMIPLFSVNGILLLRLAENFSVHAPNLGTLGKRIVLWNKIAGWMMASVVLIIPGLIVGVVGGFSLWRLLARTRKQSVPAAAA